MSPKINSHVTRLNRFLPFTVVFDQIFEEYQDDSSLSLATLALHYAQKAVNANANCIVLTGDAGHGKTHLCRRLIEEVLGYSSSEARTLLREKCNGEHVLISKNGGEGPKLRIHKDFSELGIDKAAELIERATKESLSETLVICANEGRLRAVIGSSYAGATCEKIKNQFRTSFTSGLSSEDGLIHIINLNFQSVATQKIGDSKSLLRRALDSWVNDNRRWPESSCGSCQYEKSCPIRHNRRLLVDEGTLSARRIERLEELCQCVERLGHVITIREMLMFIAFLITGGLSCEDIHKKIGDDSESVGWQSSWAFYNLLFDLPNGISHDQLYKGIPLMTVFRRLDPGRIASRTVDERVLNVGSLFPEDQIDLQFSINVDRRHKVIDGARGIEDFLGNPQSRSELSKEAELLIRPVRALRRRAFFDDGEAAGTLMKRLGFRHGDSFLDLLNGSLDNPQLIKLKSELVLGLHAIQGLRLANADTVLHLVDPAFGRSNTDTAIIARRIPSAQISLLRAKDAWNQKSSWEVKNSVDWIDRVIVVRVDEGEDGFSNMQLDLLSFEAILRSGTGHISEDFYALEIRRIRAYLGRLAAKGRSTSGEIVLFRSGIFQAISIDTGMIQVGVI